MLANPDIQPSASINRWIVSILTFHFALVHVKGTFHGPDGLSRRPRQPDDPPEGEPDDFEDWVDRLHGFIHIINDFKPTNRQPTTQSFISILASAQISSKEEDDSYEQVPRSENARKDDLKLIAIRKWHKDLERPLHLSEQEYKTFLRYATEFFPDHD